MQRHIAAINGHFLVMLNVRGPETAAPYGAVVHVIITDLHDVINILISRFDIARAANCASTVYLTSLLSHS